MRRPRGRVLKRAEVGRRGRALRWAWREDVPPGSSASGVGCGVCPSCLRLTLTVSRSASEPASASDDSTHGLTVSTTLTHSCFGCIFKKNAVPECLCITLVAALVRGPAGLHSMRRFLTQSKTKSLPAFHRSTNGELGSVVVGCV